MLAVLLTALTVSGWLAINEEKEDILREVKQRGTDISRLVSRSLVYSVIGYDYHTIDLLLKDIVQFEDISYSKVVNVKGNTMAEEGVNINDSKEKIVIFNESIILDNEVVGVLTLGFSTKNVFKKIEKLKFSLISREALIILLIAVGEFIALSFIIIKPLSIISNSLKDRDEENELMLKNIPIPSNDEFGALAEQFNKMTQHLNIANSELQSRVNYADKELIKTNNLLLERSAELMDMSQKFEKLSITDSLTGLHNRRYFEEMLKDKIEEAKRYSSVCSLLVIDIDHFKKINDIYGHSNGDMVIKMIAEVMKKRLRESDILCRIGGEEFVVMCKRAGKKDAVELSETLRKTIEDEVTNIDNDDVKVTVSIGIATVTEKNVDIYSDGFFKYADTALYQSKESGRNCVTHYDDVT